MSLNSLLIDSGSKGWADLYVDTLKVYNDLTVCGDIILPNGVNIQDINAGPNNTFLHTNLAGDVVWEPISSLPSDTNIYNSSGVLSENRIIDFDNNSLTFDNTGDIILSQALIDNPNALKILTRNTVSGRLEAMDPEDILTSVSTGGTSDGSVLTYNSGNVSFEPIPDDHGCLECAPTPSNFTGSSGEKVFALSSNNYDITTTLPTNNASGVILTNNAVFGDDIKRCGAFCSINPTITTNAFDANHSAFICSNGGSMINSNNNCGIICTQSTDLTDNFECTALDSQASSISNSTRTSIISCIDVDADNCLNTSVLSSNNLSVSGLDNVVVGGDTNINWSLDSDTGDIACTGGVTASTLSGTLQESDIAPGSNGDMLLTIGGTPSWRPSVGANVNARWVLATNMSPDAEELVSFDAGASDDNGSPYITLGANLLRANVNGTYLITCYWSHDSGPTLNYYVNINQNGIGGTVLCARYSISDRTTTMTFTASLSSGDTIGIVKRKSNPGDPTLASNTSSEAATSMISMVKLI